MPRSVLCPLQSGHFTDWTTVPARSPPAYARGRLTNPDPSHDGHIVLSALARIARRGCWSVIGSFMGREVSGTGGVVAGLARPAHKPALGAGARDAPAPLVGSVLVQ